jgi:hypothetical protein
MTNRLTVFRVGLAAVVGVALGVGVALRRAPIAGSDSGIQEVDSLQDFAEVYGLVSTFRGVDDMTLLAARRDAVEMYNLLAMPLLTAKIDRGDCEILAPGQRLPYDPCSLDLLTISDGVTRRAELSPAEYPEILEARVRCAWLTRECLRRGLGME